MNNPWLKTNPFLSMWLSSVNQMAGTMRSQATSQAKRQITAAVTKATKDNLKAFTGAASASPPKSKPKAKPWEARNSSTKNFACPPQGWQATNKKTQTGSLSVWRRQTQIHRSLGERQYQKIINMLPKKTGITITCVCSPGKLLGACRNLSVCSNNEITKYWWLL